MTRISALRNLGPVMERLLAEIDVRTEADLRRLGAIEACDASASSTRAR
jgi:hypothetical protein